MVSPVRAATVLAAAVHGWYLVAPRIEQDDELGQLTLDRIPARGATVQDISWGFKWMRGTSSTWSYTLRYLISRS